MEVRRFDVRSASDEELHQLHRLTVASLAIDRPEEDVRSFDEFVGRLHNPPPGFGEPTRWFVKDDDQVVAWATVYFPVAENQHLGLVEIFMVDPAVRGKGIGTALLRALLPAMIAGDRTTIEAWAVAAGGPGERWAHGHGFRTTQAMLTQQLLVQQVDPALWDLAPPAGYRPASWQGRCPDDLVESFAVARTAITDAPTGESAAAPVEWTAARVREVERELAEARIENWICVAVEESTGAVVALTAVEQHPHRRDWAYQNDTAVLAGHRGHGLGRYIKAAMVRSLVAGIPELRRVVTHTATTNVHMIATNHAIGYVDERVQVVLTHDVRTLADAQL